MSWLSSSFTYNIKGALSGLRQFLAPGSLLKWWKMLLFHLKSSFFLKIFKFLLWLSDHVQNSLIRNIMLISKFVTSQTGKQTIAIHILSNISRSKSNQTMKFVQLIEYNMKHFSWKIMHKIWWKNYSHTLFQKIKIQRISELIVYKVLYSLFYCMPSFLIK